MTIHQWIFIKSNKISWRISVMAWSHRKKKKVKDIFLLLQPKCTAPWKVVQESKYIQPKNPSKNILAQQYQKVSNQPYKNEMPTACPLFRGNKNAFICNGCYSCCLVHSCELFRCDYDKYRVQIHIVQNKNIYEMRYISQ